MKCIVCGTDDFDDCGICNVCVACGAKHDAWLWFNANKKHDKERFKREWYIGDLSGLTQEERTQYMRSFDNEASRLQGKANQEKQEVKVDVQEDLGYGE